MWLNRSCRFFQVVTTKSVRKQKEDEKRKKEEEKRKKEEAKQKKKELEVPFSLFAPSPTVFFIRNKRSARKKKPS